MNIEVLLDGRLSEDDDDDLDIDVSWDEFGDQLLFDLE
jgi:hypothetical protein